MTFEVQQTRWDRIVRRVSGSIGPGSRVGETLPELFPVLDVENVPPELFLLGGTLLAMGSSELSAGAGLFANIGIFNPLGSGKLITVTTCVVGVNFTGKLLWSTSHTAFTTEVTTKASRDTRVVSPEIPVGQIREETSAGLLTHDGQARVTLSDPLTLHDSNGIAVLSPGGGFAVATGTTNKLITAAFFWKERVAEASELSL